MFLFRYLNARELKNKKSLTAILEIVYNVGFQHLFSKSQSKEEISTLMKKEHFCAEAIALLAVGLMQCNDDTLAQREARFQALTKIYQERKDRYHRLASDSPAYNGFVFQNLEVVNISWHDVF